MNFSRDRVILAADELDFESCRNLVKSIGKEVYAVKIHNLYDSIGPSIVNVLFNAGARRVWVDLKYYDIPNTVKLRARAVENSGAHILSIHAEGEIEMMMAALEGAPGLEVCAITIPTSLSEEQAHLLTGQSTKAAVLYRARLAKLAGLKYVVCSPQEVEMIKKRPELAEMNVYTSGVRSPGQDAADQKRIDTPIGALKSGSTRLVVGRQITQAKDPEVALEKLEEELKEYFRSLTDPNS